MTVRLYMDHHSPAAITAGLRHRNVDVVTAQEDGRTDLDERLLERATQLERVLFSQDRDLLIIAHHWLSSKRSFAGLLYAHQLNITIGRAIADLELVATALEPADMQNRIQFLPL